MIPVPFDIFERYKQLARDNGLPYGQQLEVLMGGADNGAALVTQQDYLSAAQRHAEASAALLKAAQDKFPASVANDLPRAKRGGVLSLSVA
jgi:hypothetical protein